MDEKSIALAENMGGLAEAIESGVIPAQDADEALQALYDSAADGEANLQDILDEVWGSED